MAKNTNWDEHAELINRLIPSDGKVDENKALRMILSREHQAFVGVLTQVANMNQEHAEKAWDSIKSRWIKTPAHQLAEEYIRNNCPHITVPVAA